MSPDEHALLSAIEAAPADDLPRLVYADWLEEHGQAVRAEFVRLQCEIARLEAARDEIRSHHVPLWQRQAELLARHRDELLGPLAGLPGRVEIEFKRGFPARVELAVADFLTHGAALTAARPRPRVRVNQVGADLAGFVGSPHLGCVTELAAYAPGLLDRPPELWDGVEIDLADAAGRLTRLEVLDLEGCGLGNWFGDLFWNFTLPALVELDLSNNFLTDAGVADLLRCHLPKRLILGGNPITDQGATELADRLRDAPVEYLNLRRTLIGPAGHAALLATFNRVGKKVDLF
jgi:uncharacterized protein (TIGR02996 family)